uniref:Uncharacterized protein n=1 Tax=Anguilla anguilla TaxID=7936 RepID=A0A0E9RUH4_ANGAN
MIKSHPESKLNKPRNRTCGTKWASLWGRAVDCTPPLSSATSCNIV